MPVIAQLRARTRITPHKSERNITRVAIALRLMLDVLVPQDRQRDVLALQLAMDGCPVGLDMTTMALLGPGVGKQPCLKHRIGHLFRQRPTEAGSFETAKRRPHR